jgi:hypothetical protein
MELHIVAGRRAPKEERNLHRESGCADGQRRTR